MPPKSARCRRIHLPNDPSTHASLARPTKSCPTRTVDAQRRESTGHPSRACGEDGPSRESPAGGPAGHGVLEREFDDIRVDARTHPPPHLALDRFHASADPRGEIAAETVVEAGDLDQPRRLTVGPPVDRSALPVRRLEHGSGPSPWPTPAREAAPTGGHRNTLDFAHKCIPH